MYYYYTYYMKVSNLVFRCLVASRHIRAGETVFLESSALAVGPGQSSAAQCLVCRRKVGTVGCSTLLKINANEMRELKTIS